MPVHSSDYVRHACTPHKSVVVSPEIAFGCHGGGKLYLIVDFNNLYSSLLQKATSKAGSLNFELSAVSNIASCYC